MESIELLDLIKVHIEKHPEDDEVFTEELNNMLDDLLGQDFFGTEGQNDPRGDRRND